MLWIRQPSIPLNWKPSKSNTPKYVIQLVTPASVDVATVDVAKASRLASL